jgi:hypothetical protein
VESGALRSLDVSDVRADARGICAFMAVRQNEPRRGQIEQAVAWWRSGARSETWKIQEAPEQ